MKNYPLIDVSGRTHITATDRKALEMMLAAECIRCTTTRKEYALRGQNGAELRTVIERLKHTIADRRSLPCDRLASGRMLSTIQSRMIEDLCLVLLSWDKGDIQRSNTSKQLLFLHQPEQNHRLA